MNSYPSTARRRRSALTVTLATLAAVIATMALSGPASAAPLPLPEAPNCPVFPANNHWNLRVDRLRKLPGSSRIIGGIGRNAYVHNNFGGGVWAGGPDGIPIRVVGGNQPRVPITFEKPSQSDPGPYPYPRDARPMWWGDPDADHHVVVVDRDNCRLYESYKSRKLNGGRAWKAFAGATWNLRSNLLRPNGWTSADGAGLPLLPGLVRYEEVARGRIDHALRMAVPATRRGWIYPARHDTRDNNDPRLPQYGMRLRLKRSFKIKRFPRQARIVLKAMKRYGVFVAEEGKAFHYSGEPDPRWSYRQLHKLRRVKGKHFEVVDTSRLPRPRE